MEDQRRRSLLDTVDKTQDEMTALISLARLYDYWLSVVTHTETHTSMTMEYRHDRLQVSQIAGNVYGAPVVGRRLLPKLHDHFAQIGEELREELDAELTAMFALPNGTDERTPRLVKLRSKGLKSQSADDTESKAEAD